MEGPGSECCQGQDISLLQNFLTGSEVQSLWVRRPESGVDHTPPSSAEAINVWSHTSTPPTCFYVVEMVNLKFISVTSVLELAGMMTALSWLTPTAREAVLTFRRRIKSRLPFVGIIRSLPYSTRFQDKG